MLLACDLVPDRFEDNDTIETATTLGAITAVAERGLTIEPATDVDFFNYTAHETGLVVVSIFFSDDDGDIDLRVRDAHGNILAASESPNDNERLSLPVIAQQRYFVEVFGFEGATNCYELQIETYVAPVPSAVILDANDDSGRRDDDNVTNREDARILVQADLRQFQAFAVPILDADQVEAGGTGAAVQIFVNGLPVGIADRLFDANWFDFTFSAGDLTATGLPIGTPDDPDAMGFMNVVSAVVRVSDPQSPPFVGTGELSPPLVLTYDPTAPSASTSTIALLESSDSGVVGDMVTNETQPGFAGVAEASGQVRVLATNVTTETSQIVGQGVAGSDESDGVADGLGTWEVTVEPLVDGVYDIFIQIEDRAGNVSEPSAPVRIEIDTMSPNTPRLDLREADDTGRNNDDDVTRVTTPLLSATSHDPNAATHLQSENFIYRIFDRVGESAEVLLYDSQVVLGGYTSLSRIVTSADGSSGDSILGPLADGVHNLKLEVEDRAGNVSADDLLDLVIDTQTFLGEGNLHPDSDTGAQDRITSDQTPAFFGVAEADNLVIVRIDGVRAASTVAVPRDGDDAFQPPLPPNAPVQGNWQAVSTTWLGEGEHTVIFTFEDLAGNQVTSQPLSMFVVPGEPPIDPGPGPDTGFDREGPRITNVTYGDIIRRGLVISNENTTSLFRPKPDSGPDPLISSIIVHVSDGPARSADFTDEALRTVSALEEGQYELVGDANGPIPIIRVLATYITESEVEALAEVELIFHSPVGESLVDLEVGAPLPDDRYTLRISDRLVDPSGNALDGESGALAPFEGNDAPDATPPIFPSGDGRPGGDFVARFTVDSRPEFGTWASGSVWVDTNGDFQFDPENRDYTNRDITYRLGNTSDSLFAGNFAAGARSPADGFDKLAAYGRIGDTFRWLVDTNNDGVPDVSQSDPANVRGLPVAGRFDGSDTNGDEVGVFTGRIWHFDTDHDFQVDSTLPSHLVGYPVVGDFDGDGFDDLATWADDTFQVDLADGARRGWDGTVDASFRFGFAGVRERPVAADMDQDGFEDLGLWVPDQAPGSGQWYVLMSAGESVLDRIQDDTLRGDPTVSFTPKPLGDDLFARFGYGASLPVVGNFDPPLAAEPARQPTHQTVDTAAAGTVVDMGNPMDVNRDGYVSPIDALLVIHALEKLSQEGTGAWDQELDFDVNQDGAVSPLDALLVIDWLSKPSPPQEALELSRSE